MSFLPPIGGARRRDEPSSGPSADRDADANASPVSGHDSGASSTHEHGDGRIGDRSTGDGLRRDGAPPAPTEKRAGEASGADGRRRVSQRPGHSLGGALGLTALSTALPGAGLVRTRYRALGWLLLALLVGGLAWLVWWVDRNGALVSALDVATWPGLARWGAFIIIATGLVWAGAVLLTAVASRPRPLSSRQRWVLTGFTGLMCLLVAAPVSVGVWYVTAHNAAVDQIFARPAGGADEDDDRERDRPRMEEPDPWAHLGRVNVLLLGSDAGDNREGVRTDSMMVASVNTHTGDLVLFGIPRNLQNVPIPEHNPLSRVWPDGFDCGAECLMNGIWTEAERVAEENPGWYAGDPTPGLTATRDVISSVLGQPIHHTVIVNLQGFEDLVDAMGGVHIDVQERLPMGGQSYTDEQGRSWLIEGTENGWIEPGPQHLDGREALWYSRSRVTTDDFSRMRRQRCVVAAVINQVDPATMLQRYPRIAAAAGDNVRVDIPRDELPAWAELVQRIQETGTMKSLPFTIENTDVTDPNYSAIRLEVYRALHPRPETTATAGPDDATRTATATPTGPTATTAPHGGDPGAEGPTDPAGTSQPTDELSEIAAVC